MRDAERLDMMDALREKQAKQAAEDSGLPVSLEVAKQILEKAEKQKLSDFLKAYKELCKEYGYELRAQPVTVQNGEFFGLTAQLSVVKLNGQ